MHKDDVTESFIAQPEARNKAQILCKDPFQGWKTRNAKVMPSWEKTGRSSQLSTTNGDLAAIPSREPRVVALCIVAWTVQNEANRTLFVHSAQ